MDGDGPTESAKPATTDQSEGNTDRESSDNRRGFLRSLVLKATTVTTAASVALSGDIQIPGSIQSSEDRDGESDDERLSPNGNHRKKPRLEQPPEVRIPFDTPDAKRVFSRHRVTGHNHIVDAPDTASRSLQVTIPAEHHYGTSLRYQFTEAGMTEPTELYSRYYLYIPSEFEFRGDDRGKLPGPAGTYGKAGWGGRPSDGTNGWSARMSFGPPNGNDAIQLSSYVYHADMDGQTGNHFWWDIGDAGRIERDEWHQIDNYVQMNTPGENDGVLRGWIDGNLALDETSLRFREINRLKIEGYWFNVYYGGAKPSPSDNAVQFRNLTLWSVE